MPKNEFFTVSAQFKNTDSERFPDSYLGVALIDKNNNIAEIMGNVVIFYTLPNATSRTFTLGCFVPKTVQPEQYKLRMVIKPLKEEEWKIITKSAKDDVPNVINFTVTAEGPASGSGLSMVIPYIPEAVIQSVPTSERVVPETYTFNTRGRDFLIYYTFPKTIDGNTKIFFLMHGQDGNPKTYIDYFKYLSEKENIIVIAPRFYEDQSEYASYYANLDIANNINSPENWTSKITDEIFLDFKQRFALSNEKYILYGFSAGSNFTSKSVMFSESPYLDYAISSNTGNNLFLDETKNYTSGIKNLLMYKNLIINNFSRKMYILGGNADPYFPGANTLGFYLTSKDYCAQNGGVFNWNLIIMDNVAHEFRKPLPFVIDIIKGIYDAKKGGAK
jgi:hypothetical protein